MKINSLSDGVYFVSEDTKILDLGSLNINYLFQGGDETAIVYKYIRENENEKYKVIKTLQDYLKNEKGIDWGNVWLANAYETEHPFIFNKEPKRISYLGSGFNYGSNNIIRIFEPGYILVIAEND